MLKRSDVPTPTFPVEMPMELGAERSILGTVLAFGTEALDRVTLDADVFSIELHRAIFDAARQLSEDGHHVSPVSVTPFVSTLPGPNERTSAGDYVRGLAAHAVGLAELRTYTAMVADVAARRRLIEVAQSAISAASGRVPVAEIGAMLVSEVSDALSRNGVYSAPGRHLGDAAASLLAKLGQPDAAGGINIGLPDLAKITGPWLPGQAIVLAGATGTFKTTVALQIAINAAANGAAVGFVSQEMADVEMAERALSCITLADGNAVPAENIRSTAASNEVQYRALVAAQERLKKLPIDIVDRAGMRAGEVAAYVRHASKRFGRPLDLLVVDYLGLLAAEARYRGQKAAETGELSTAMKRLAMSSRTCVLLLHQFNRGQAARENKRPTKSDLRDSGQIEQDADKILLTYSEVPEIKREIAHLESAGDKEGKIPDLLARLAQVEDTIEVIVDKNRMGPVGTTTLHVSAPHYSVASLARGVR